MVLLWKNFILYNIINEIQYVLFCFILFILMMLLYFDVICIIFYFILFHFIMFIQLHPDVMGNYV